MPASPHPTTTQTPAPNDIRTVAFVSLGCPKNLVDSEKMLGLLAESGLVPVNCSGDGDDHNQHHDEPTDTPHKPQNPGWRGADVVVVNTCGFLEASKDESLSVIQDALRDKQAGLIKRVVVAGCLVQRHRAKMLEWAPGIDAMVGVFDRDKIVEAVKGHAAGQRHQQNLAAVSDNASYWIAGNAHQAAAARGMNTVGLTVNGSDGKGIGYFEDDSARLRLTPRHWSYLRVSEGCNQRCAFCTIPSIRGKMRSKPLDRIRREAVELIADGAFELSLIGQDTTSYGDDIGIGFKPHADTAHQPTGGLPELLRTVNHAFDDAGVKQGWIRLMYAYPTNFSSGMIRAIADMSILNRGRVVPYIDIPLQHASDNMLTAMRRNVTAQRQRDLIDELRDTIPGMAIRTTFITGFPGETEDDHLQLLALLEDMAFDAMGVFQYSPEDGTPAGTMELDPALRVDPETKQRRHDELMALQQRIAFEQAAYLAEQFDPKDPADSGVRLDILIDSRTTTAGLATTGVNTAGHLYKGRTYFQAPQIDAVTYVHSKKPLSPGELVPCVIVDSAGYDLVARPVEELSRAVSLRVLSR